MSANFSLASNSSNFLDLKCSTSKVSADISLVIAAVRTILTLPLSIFVLYLGLQRWRQQRSSTSTSHSDVFAYHMAVMDLIWGFGYLCYYIGVFVSLPEVIILGMCTFFIAYSGNIFFHLLTCVEWYLAVVHPVIYLGLRQPGGVRIRNISIGCVWLLSSGPLAMPMMFPSEYPLIPFACLLVFSLIVVSFCSFSVLCALVRPAPGERGRGKEFVDQSKQRAFHTVTAIMGTLWLWFAGTLVSAALVSSPLLNYDAGCMAVASTGFFNLPSSLVLPLLYLHRTGKLSWCCHNS